jgi:YggT family protein
MLAITLIKILMVLLNVIWWIIVVQAVLSWLIAFNVINTYNPTVRSIWQALDRLTEPLYRPIRRIMPDFGALDLSPMVVLLLLYIVSNIILPDLLISVANPAA